MHSEAIERLADASSVHGKSVGGDLNEDDPSSLYTICCIDQCEEFLSHLENKIGALQSSHHTLARLVAEASSKTVDTPRKLPRTLTLCLDKIAQHHGRVVPLYNVTLSLTIWKTLVIAVTRLEDRNKT